MKISAIPALFALTLFATSPAAPQENLQGRTVTRTFPAVKGGALRVTLDAGNVHVTGGTGDNVVVHVNGLEEDEQDALNIGEQENTVYVESNSGDDLQVDVEVPSHFDVNLQTSDGDIQIDGRLIGTIRGATGGGNLTLGNVGGKIDMSTSGGDVTAGDLAGDATLTTSGGNIQLGSVTGEVDVTTAGGDIIVHDVGKRLRAATSGGDIQIGNVAGSADVSTSGGNVDVGTVSGNASLRTSGGNVDLRGASGSVRASTAGGDMILSGLSGRVDANSSAGSVEAAFASSPSDDCKLVTSTGDVQVTVAANVRMTVSARIRVWGWWRSESRSYDIESDFPMNNYEKDETRREIHATIDVNGGGKVVTVESTMGNIRVLKAGHQR